MNKERRKELSRANDMLEEIRDKLGEVQDIIDNCKSEEEDYRDNMPENMQNSDRYYAADSAIDEMQEAYDALTDMIDNIDDISGHIEAASE